MYHTAMGKISDTSMTMKIISDYVADGFFHLAAEAVDYDIPDTVRHLLRLHPRSYIHLDPTKRLPYAEYVVSQDPATIRFTELRDDADAVMAVVTPERFKNPDINARPLLQGTTYFYAMNLDSDYLFSKRLADDPVFWARLCISNNHWNIHVPEQVQADDAYWKALPVNDFVESPPIF